MVHPISVGKHQEIIETNDLWGIMGFLGCFWRLFMLLPSRIVKSFCFRKFEKSKILKWSSFFGFTNILQHLDVHLFHQRLLDD